MCTYPQTPIHQITTMVKYRASTFKSYNRQPLYIDHPRVTQGLKIESIRVHADSVSDPLPVGPCMHFEKGINSCGLRQVGVPPVQF